MVKKSQLISANKKTENGLVELRKKGNPAIHWLNREMHFSDEMNASNHEYEMIYCISFLQYHSLWK